MNGWHLLSGNAGFTSSHQCPLIGSPASPLCHCCSIIEMIVALQEITVLTGSAPELLYVFIKIITKRSESPVYLVLWRATVECSSDVTK